MATLHAEVFDVGAQGFGDPQPVQGQQRGQGVVPVAPIPGGRRLGTSADRPHGSVVLCGEDVIGAAHIDAPIVSIREGSVTTPNVVTESPHA